ncbi:hypothetical protein SD71_05770 [Cohnella kolymensis]|uniref:DUF4179 domain-containing protein n=1 Tax=Cohnella kolymensis TaxID=1590652 RepID=A0ABR5A6U3_9BACL|nr:DUF4179 domain-containing protein [Cohnella kolymensis]KIL36761.1 hypothetical protein SD71_05770 [Cohnella kolymensis]
MNDVELDRLLREQANPGAAIPAKVSQRIEQTLHTLPNREAARRRLLMRRWGFSAVSVAILGVVVAVLAMFSTPEMKSALNRVPVIGSLLFKGDDKLGQSVTDQGITFSISRVIYDGFAMSIDYALQSDEEVKGTGLDFKIKVDDLLINKYDNDPKYVHYLHINDRRLDSRNHEGVIMIKLDRYRPDSFHMQLEVTKVGETSGNWDFALPVTTTPDLFIKPALNKINDLLSITLDKIIFSPLNTEIWGDYDFQDASGNIVVGLEVTDDTGYIYDSSYFFDGRLHVRHLNPKARQLVLKPYYYDNEGIYRIENPQYIRQTLQKPPTAAKPFVISQTGGNKLVVTSIEYLEDRCIVHYHTEGSNPSIQSILIIEDENGESMYAVSSTTLDHSGSEHIKEFRRFAPDDKITFLTWPVPPITYIPDMEMRVDLPQ